MKKTKKVNSKFLIILFVILCFMIACFAMCRFYSGVFIDKKPVTRNEYVFYESQNVALSYDSSDDYSGLLQEKTLTDIQRMRALQIVSNEYLGEQDLRFTALETEWDRFNQERQKVLRAGGIVYGPDALSFEEYINYETGNLEKGLIDSMALEILGNPNQLKEAYNQLPTEILDSRKQVTLCCYSIEPEEFSLDMVQATTAYEALQTALQKEKLSQKQADSLSALPVFIKEVSIDSKTMSREDEYLARLLAMADGLIEGDVFEAPLAPGSDTKALFYIDYVKQPQKPSLEDCSMTVALLAAQNSFDEKMDVTMAELKEKTTLWSWKNKH